MSPRIAYCAVRCSLLTAGLGTIFSLAESPPVSPRISAKPGSSAILRSVKVVSDAEGPALEIISSRPLQPAIESLDNPPRLVIDLPDTRVPSPRQRIVVRREQIRGVRIKQFQQTPPVVRVVLDLTQPVGYSTDEQGQRFLVRLRPMSEAGRMIPEPPSVPAFTKGVQPAVIPISPGASGAVVEVGSGLAGGASVTANTDTTILHLARGGEVRICPGTTLSITTSQNGRDLMLGMSTGALEAHYSLTASADSVVTSDFRILFSGPGEFHYAFSADAHGNTCVRALRGDTATVTISEFMGNGTYQVKPNEQVVFRSGRINLMDASVPDDCGCPPPAIPVMRASAASAPTIAERDLPQSLHLAQPRDNARMAPSGPSPDGLPGQAAPSHVAVTVSPPGMADMPAAAPGTAHVQVDAPLVFRASPPAPPSAPNLEAENLPISHAAVPAPLFSVAEPLRAEARHSKSFLTRIRSFFAAIFR